MDATGQHWQKGALHGKPFSLFTSTATQNGGQVSGPGGMHRLAGTHALWHASVLSMSLLFLHLMIFIVYSSPVTSCMASSKALKTTADPI